MDRLTVLLFLFATALLVLSVRAEDDVELPGDGESDGRTFGLIKKYHNRNRYAYSQPLLGGGGLLGSLFGGLGGGLGGGYYGGNPYYSPYGHGYGYGGGGGSPFIGGHPVNPGGFHRPGGYPPGYGGYQTYPGGYGGGF